MMDVVSLLKTVTAETTIKRKLAMAIVNTQEMIESCLESEILRLDKNAFTRNRRLGAKRILNIILRRIYRSLQLCLDEYFKETEEEPVSKQAFSKARKNLDPEFVRSFADMTSKLAAEDDSMPSYEGMRLIAIDGSDVALENTKELKKAFGCSGPKNDAATALISIAYGPLDHAIYDCRIGKYATDERDLARLHIGRLLELGLGGSLLLFDRWYPSAEFVAFLYESGFHFVMRLRDKFNLNADAIKTQGRIDLTHEGKTYSVRVLKVPLSTGETETLITSLNQKKLPIINAGSLYFERWRVETAYDLIKSKLELENFSGKTKVSVLQDFYATIYLANIAAFAAGESDALISEADNGKSLKYPRKANRNRTISKLRDSFLCLIMEPDEEKRNALLDKITTDIARYPLSVKPGRSPARKKARKKKYNINRKSVV